PTPRRPPPGLPRRRAPGGGLQRRPGPGLPVVLRGLRPAAGGDAGLRRRRAGVDGGGGGGDGRLPGPPLTSRGDRRLARGTGPGPGRRRLVAGAAPGRRGGGGPLHLGARRRRDARRLPCLDGGRCRHPRAEGGVTACVSSSTDWWAWGGGRASVIT